MFTFFVKVVLKPERHMKCLRFCVHFSLRNCIEVSRLHRVFDNAVRIKRLALSVYTLWLEASSRSFETLYKICSSFTGWSVTSGYHSSSKTSLFASMTPSNKRRLYVTFQHRSGLPGFHWAIMIAPKVESSDANERDNYLFHATNAIAPGLPSGWRFEHKPDNSMRSGTRNERAMVAKLRVGSESFEDCAARIKDAGTV